MLQQLADQMPSHSPLGNKARGVANDIMNTFRGRLDDVAECRKLAQKVLGDGKVDYRSEQAGDLWAIGYCHIDTAWLWPWSSTQQKIARSWSSQVSSEEAVLTPVGSDGPLSRIPIHGDSCSALQMVGRALSQAFRESCGEDQVWAVW